MKRLAIVLIVLWACATGVAMAEEAPAPESAPAETAPVEESPAATQASLGPAGSSKLQLDTTSVTGNQELPKVLVIVPWKKAEIGDLRGRPVGSLLDEVLAPVDREVFQRRLKYYDEITTSETESAEE